MPPPIPVQPPSIHLQIKIRHHLRYLRRRQGMPHIHNSSSSSWQHAILQTIEILAVDGRYELARRETEENAW
jgi:hypothetical protein